MITLDLTATPFAPLSAHLLDLLYELDGRDVPLVLVGGYSLFLRRLLVEQSGATTLYKSIPTLRATEDFDVVLKLELLADMSRLQALRAAIDRLGYRVVKGAEKYQFKKPGTDWEGHGEVKIDLLARIPGPRDPPLHHDERRISNQTRNNPLHARCTPEAIAVEDGLQETALEGKRTSGDQYTGTVFLPAPYAIYMMKLFAFRDEESGSVKPRREQYAQKHALDLYTLTALLTAEDYDALGEYRTKYGNHPAAREASEIVARYFSHGNATGSIRIREHGSFPRESQLDDFLALVAEVFLP